MVSVKQIGDEHAFVQQNYAVELSKCLKLPLRGLRIPLYKFGEPIYCRKDTSRTYCAFEEQNLLDVFLLAQWEDRAWKGLVQYDVTSCETKVVSEKFKFLLQWNNEWASKDLIWHTNSKPKTHSIESSNMCIQREDLLFSVASGDNMSPELVPPTKIPSDGCLIIMNENPVEYGHVYLVPFTPCSISQMVDMRSLELALQMANEVNNCSFRVCYVNAAACTPTTHFQACYLAKPLPVELLPGICLSGSLLQGGIEVCELIDYPVKTLLFKSRDHTRAMVELVAEISTCLQDQGVLFNLLISDCGTTIFLFPQPTASKPGNGSNLTAWECAGHFVVCRETDFIAATEEAIVERLTSSSLDNAAFDAVKQLCRDVASKLFH